ncbi:MAG: chromate transporter [Candidatus Ventricola sp.]
MILFELFCAFFEIALFSIGGGYAAMPLIRSQVVQAHGWMTMNEFADLLTIAEMTPGPIQLNAATFAGMRVAGFPGAVCASLGAVAPSLLLVSLLAYLYRRYQNLSVIQGVLGFLRPAVVALIASAGLDVLLLVLFNGQPVALKTADLLGAGLFVLALVLLRVRKMSPILVMVLCGVLSLAAGAVFGMA